MFSTRKITSDGVSYLITLYSWWSNIELFFLLKIIQEKSKEETFLDITVVHNGYDLSFSLKEIKSHLTNVLCIEIHRFFKDGQLSCSWACSRDKLMPFYHLWLCVYIIYLFLYVSLHLSIHQLSIDLSIIYGGRRGSCCSVAKWWLTLCPHGLQHSRLLCPPLSAGGHMPKDPDSLVRSW